MNTKIKRIKSISFGINCYRYKVIGDIKAKKQNDIGIITGTIESIQVPINMDVSWQFVKQFAIKVIEDTVKRRLSVNKIIWGIK